MLTFQMTLHTSAFCAQFHSDTPSYPLSLLWRLKVELSLVAMKAGCLRSFEALWGGGGAAVPPTPAAVLPGVVSALALPPPVAFAAPMVQAVAFSADGGSYRARWAMTCEEAPGRGFSPSGLCFSPFWGICILVCFCSVV